jgi:tRNA threonylcarbamoyl adenosine modification protein YeaZ
VNQSPEHVAIALSASGEHFAVALQTRTGAVHARAVDAKRQSAAALALLDELLAASCHQVGDIKEVRVDRGPGSYTGLRMALTTARVLAAFGGAALAATTSFELIALGLLRREPVLRTRPVLVLLDARRERVHAARVVEVAGLIALAAPPTTVALGAAADLVARDDVVVASSALRPALPALRDLHAVPAIDARDMFDARLRCAPADPATLEPLYLMGFADPVQ